MGMHISARLAWHDDGWNGICADPRKNTYCSGRHSYPGDLIAITRRKDDWEVQPEFFGKDCSTLERMPPCMYSINAFGKKLLKASSEPPDFSDFNAQKHEWEMPPSTVCVWPYEEMYSNEVKRAGGGYDNDKRFSRAKALFEHLTADKSLIFYYTNYSNPFSEEENQRYVVVGMARIKKVGDWLFYPGADMETRQKYGGAFVWQKPITSHYPEQGVRLATTLKNKQVLATGKDGAKPPFITLSIGIAEAKESASIREMLETADTAAGTSKSQGKDRTTVA